MGRSSHDLGNDDIVVSHFTLPRYFPLEARLEAIGSAGAAGFGFYVGHWDQLASEGMTVDQLRATIERHDLCLAELEAIPLGAGSAAARDRTAHFIDVAMQLAGEFGVRYLQVIGPVLGESGVATTEQLADEFGRLCDRAATVDMTCGLEFLPFTTVETAVEAMDIVERAGRTNSGLCIDIWHHRRGPRAVDLASTVPAARIAAIQMNDGTLEPQHPDYKTDCLLNRVPPGDGAMGAVEFATTMITMGAVVPWSVEVCQQDGAVGAAHVHTSVDAMRTVLDAARTVLAPTHLTDDKENIA